jgi:hypothetical protein
VSTEEEWTERSHLDGYGQGQTGEGLCYTTETLALKPTSQSIAVRLVALAWAPCWRDRAGAVTPAWE